VYTTSRDETAIFLAEVEVGKPVSNIDASAERDYDFLSGRVCRDVATDTCLGATGCVSKGMMCLCRTGLTRKMSRW
jgi:hypothetical protein